MDFNKTYLSFRLHDDFVNKYKNKKPNFGFNGLGYAVYARTYSRLTCDDCNSLFINEDDNGELYCESCKSKNIRNEKWFETVRRVVEGTYSIQKDWIINRNLGWNEEKGIRSAKTMYRLIFEMKFLPPGRGLWAMGTPLVHQKKMFAALNNCAFVSTSNMDKNPTKPFEFMMDMSMLGVGVGFDCLGENSITINKPNKKLKTFIIEDTREGWVESVKVLLESYFYLNKAKVQFDYSKIRKYGKLIKGFGGRSSGKEPLIVLHEDIVKYLDKNINKLITLRSIADIMNSIGVCVVAGNVRRTAQMMLGDYSDNNYISLKDYTINPDRESFGWTSNNSVFANIGMNYSNVSEKIAKNGEPGLIWLENIKNYSRMGDKPDYKDIRAEGVNPCFAGETMIAVADGRNSVSIKQLVDEKQDVPVYSVEPNSGEVTIKMARNPRLTRKNVKLVKIILDDNSFIKTTLDHRFILLNGKEIEAKDLKPDDSLQRFTKTAEYLSSKNTDQYYRINCNVKNSTKNKLYEHRLIAKFYNEKKWNELYIKNEFNGFINNSNIAVHHKNHNTLDNSYENLEILTPSAHLSLHGKENSRGVKNNNYSYVTNEQMEKAALQLVSELKRKFSTEEWRANYLRLGALSEISEFRKDGWFSTIRELSEFAAKKSGYDFVHPDPRVISEYNRAIEKGYNVRLAKDLIPGNSRLEIEKTCKYCGSKYFINYSRKKQSFCSRECSLADLAKKKNQKRENEKELRSKKYIENYIKLKKNLNKEPTQEAWRKWCSEIGFNGSFSKHAPFRVFSQLKRAANEYNHKVKQIIFLEEKEDVYNLTVDDNHTVGIITSNYINVRGTRNFSGIFTFQCSEQSLESFELCCLVETFPTNHNILNEFEITLKYSYLYAKTVTLGETHWPETNRVLLRNRRIGNSMSGLAIFVADNGLNELKKWSLSGYSTIAKWDKIYSEWFAVPASIKTTSIKPSGSVSLLAGVTPGMHYPINRCYIRRMNIAKNSDLVKILSDAGYEYEDSAYDDTSYSFSFPIKLDDNIRTQDELSIWEQFSFASFLQRYWADNQVSCTISFDYATEKNEIEKCLDYFQYELKGISLLPRFNNNKKAYKQMPYEGISQEKYEHLNSKINNVDVSRNIKEMSESERFCDGDSCTIL